MTDATRGRGELTNRPTLSTRQRRSLEIALCLLILGLAVVLRIRQIDTTGIWGDQSFTLNTAMRWVNGGDIPLAANKSSVGFMNPPMIEYLYAAALRLWPDILSVAYLTMISGLLAIIAAGWSAYKVFGKRAAFWTMLMIAVNPWSVLYGQLIWNQTMVPVFSSLTLAGLLLYFVVKAKPIYLILSFVSAACMTQVHPGSSIQLAAMGLIMLVFWRRLRLWPVLAGIASFALLYLPFLLYEIGVGWGDVTAILEISRQPASLSTAAILVSFDLLHVRGLLDSVRFLSLFEGLATIVLTLSLFYALWTGVHSFRQRRAKPEAGRRAAGVFILLLWFALPILFYLRSSFHLQIYYLISQFPVHFLLIGILLDAIQDHRAGHTSQTRYRIRRIGALVAPGLLLALAGWYMIANLRIQDQRQVNRGGQVQIRHVRAEIIATRHLLAERPDCDLVAVSEGHNLEMSSLSLLREFTSPERILLSDGRLAIPVPSSCAVYLDAQPGSRASKWIETVGTPLPEATASIPDTTWRAYELPADTGATLAAPGSLPASSTTWTNGVALLEFAHGQARPGETMPLTLAWLVDRPASKTVYHIGTYLLTADGQVAAQSDGPGFDSIQWRSGDQFITWFDISIPQDLPPGIYQLAVAYYTWPDLERVSLISGESTAFLAEIELAASGANQ